MWRAGDSASDASRVVAVETKLLEVALGPERGGSGATAVQVVHVTVVDADGAQGTGFSYALTGGAQSVQTLIECSLGPKVVGSDLLAWDRIWFDLWATTHRLGRGVALPAISALDIAVWDIRARRAGLPLHRLLGAYREEVPIYGSGRATHGMSVDQLIAGVLSYAQEGFGAVKLRAGALSAEEDLERISAVREAAGPSVRLMVDCNERLDFATALWFGRRLEELDVFWLEEPLVADDVDGHARLASQLHLPIAAGEHLMGRFEFARYIGQRAASVLQPDAPLMGGVSEWMRVATLAEASNLSVSPHFLPELHVHLAAAAKACSYVEHFPLIDDLLVETLPSSGGMVTPPNRSGHGIAWDEEALERFRVR